MGAIYLFVCPHCNYEEMVSGGKDRGFFIEVETNVCKDCQRLTNVIIKTFGDSHFTEDVELNICTHCGSKNLVIWVEEDPSCPKCGIEMEIDPIQGGKWD